MGKEHLTDDELQTLLDGGILSPGRRDHLLHCASCQRALDAYRTVAGILEEDIEGLSPRFADGVMKRLKSRPAPSWEYLAIPALAIGGLTAGILTLDWTSIHGIFGKLEPSVMKLIQGIFSPFQQWVAGLETNGIYLSAALLALFLVGLVDRSVSHWKHHV